MKTRVIFLPLLCLCFCRFEEDPHYYSHGVVVFPTEEGNPSKDYMDWALQFMDDEYDCWERRYNYGYINNINWKENTWKHNIWVEEKQQYELHNVAGLTKFYSFGVIITLAWFEDSPSALIHEWHHVQMPYHDYDHKDSSWDCVRDLEKSLVDVF